jgi:hypothetical protein
MSLFIGGTATEIGSNELEHLGRGFPLEKTFAPCAADRATALSVIIGLGNTASFQQTSQPAPALFEKREMVGPAGLEPATRPL